MANSWVQVANQTWLTYNKSMTYTIFRASFLTKRVLRNRLVTHAESDFHDRHFLQV